MGFGVGNYICGDHVSCSGFDPKERTLEEHFKLIRKDDGRHWPLVAENKTHPIKYNDNLSFPYDGNDMINDKFYPDDQPLDSNLTQA